MKTQLNEVSLSRFFSHLKNKDDCMICISSERNEITDPRERKQRQKDLEDYIKKGKFAFNKVLGGFTENLGTEEEVDVTEKSFLVFFKKERLQEAMLYFKNLAKMFDQDSFLLVANGESKYIDKNGNIDMELGEWYPKQLDAYFTQLKNGRKFSFDTATITEGDNHMNISHKRSSDNICENLKNGICELESPEEYKANLKEFLEWTKNL